MPGSVNALHAFWPSPSALDMLLIFKMVLLRQVSVILLTQAMALCAL